MEVRDFDVIKEVFQMYDNSFSINYAPGSPFFGSFQDRVNVNTIGKTLMTSLESLFENHSAGVLLAESLSLGVMHCNDKYYFIDSLARRIFAIHKTEVVDFR